MKNYMKTLLATILTVTFLMSTTAEAKKKKSHKVKTHSSQSTKKKKKKKKHASPYGAVQSLPEKRVVASESYMAAARYLQQGYQTEAE